MALKQQALWSCSQCTFLNEPIHGRCSMCGTLKVQQQPNIAKKKNTTTTVRTITTTTTTTSGTKSKKSVKRQYRQATESSNNEVEILCFSCRRNPKPTIQKSLASFFVVASKKSLPEQQQQLLLCCQCRQPLEKKRPKSSAGSSRTFTKCPYIQRLDGYKKLAADHELPFDLTDSYAIQCMRQDCSLCGESAGMNGNGLTRLRHWPERYQSSRIHGKGKQCMGPFCHENIQSACGRCNLMKGYRKPREYIEACRHIATFRFFMNSSGNKKATTTKKHLSNDNDNLNIAENISNNNNTPDNNNNNTKDDYYSSTDNSSNKNNTSNDDAKKEDNNNNEKDDYNFGLYPHRFRNNISKRSRSSYITKSSTHTKTHSLTNEQFNQITSQPCHFCGKESNPPTHYNGLDRLDNNHRVYSVDTVVSCCGGCNIMKYTYSEETFLRHVLKVAKYNRETVFLEDNDEHQNTTTSNDAHESNHEETENDKS